MTQQPPTAAAMSSPTTSFDDPPRLPSLTKRHRSPLRSPTRQVRRARDVDTLLRDLSPTTTLRAFLTTPNDTATAPNTEQMHHDYHGDPDLLARSIAAVSESERALGVKAAQACLDLRTWTREVQGWQWPGRFDTEEEDHDGIADGTEELCGSLPKRVVHEYEKRADEISQQLDGMDVEELKEYVLRSHYRQGAQASHKPHMDIKRLDDFTALVTATILQALPYLTQLNRLLDIWTVRLIVLRSAAGYLQDLHRARAELKRSWAAIATSPANISVCSRESMLEMKESLQCQVASLGRRLDRFLDDLEGREETVPDSWVDNFEAMETAYGDWVVQAERAVLEDEWRKARKEASSEVVPDSQDAIKHEPLSQDSDVVQEYDKVGSAAQDDAPEQGSPATSSVSEPVTFSDSPLMDDSGGGIAKRRAAFLNDIERTNSLKLASKSPVRPFEHATNAFTKLFKKDQSPKRLVPQRSTSRNLHASTADEIGSIRPSSFRSVSAASIRLNNSSPASSVTSIAEMSNMKSEQLHAVGALPPSVQISITEPRREGHTQQADHTPTIATAIPDTYRPTGLISPSSPSRRQMFGDDWPMDSTPTSSRDVNTPIDRPELASSPGFEHELRTSATTMQTDNFDRMLVKSLPSPSAEAASLIRDIESTSPSLSSESRSQPEVASSTELDSFTPSGSEDVAQRSTRKEHPPLLKVEIPKDEDDRAVRRASAAYIGTFHRSQLKSIDVGRSAGRKSGSSMNSPSTTTDNSPSSRSGPLANAIGVDALATSPTSDESVLTSPGLPNDVRATIPETPALDRNSTDASSPIVDSEPDSPLSSASLNAVMIKRRHGGTTQKENIAMSSKTGGVASVKKFGTPKFAEDSFDRHVSEVLEALPASIKFRSRPGAATPVHGGGGGADGRVPFGPRSKVPGSRAPSRTGLMIAPAEYSSRKPASTSEPEVKLYHLTQAGREDPIKLFVRLVGEGERVMVRVGGGWADLADYLRQYAEHHGSRTVSEGALEVQTVTTVGSNRRVSGPVDFRAKTPTLVTPVRARNGGDERHTLTEEETFGSPSSRPRTPADATTTWNPTLKSSLVNSRPSTATGSRPSSRQGLTEVGLSGPSSGKRGLPDHKAKWVEGMIERAKASAEKSREGDIKELGKAGGTRRVIFRSASGGGETPK